MTDIRNRELAIQAIPYNMDMISREETESGNLTKDMLKAMTGTVPMPAMGVKRFDRIPIYGQNARVGHGQYASGPARKRLA